jgi:ferric-dicitrate binding protein FerR (iron transport regulator)
MTPATRGELDRLLSALCDGRLTDADHARLEQLLDADAECRRHYLEYVDVHARLLVHPRYGAGAPAVEPARPRPVRHGWRYLLVAAATLAASLLVQIAWLHPRAPEGGGPPVAAVRPTPRYVATITQAADCVWDDASGPGRVGSRLLTGVVRLKSGVARLRFDGGSDLVVEGPAALRLDSDNSATVLSGQVVFRADDLAGPFDLHTPNSTLVDFGTEYAVAVGPQGEEVHVFDGEVRRTPNAGTSEVERLVAGQARRYGQSPDDAGQPTQLDPARFVRRLDGPAQPPRDAADGLLAYEGFDYHDPNGLEAGTAAGGFGWVGPWTPGFARPTVEGDPNRLALNVKEGLTRPGAAAVGGSFDYRGFAKYFRRLATPVRLDADGIYYLSFLFRREGPPADPLNALAVLLRTTDELEREQRNQEDPRLRLNVGIGGPNEAFTHLQKIGVRTPLPLSYGTTYLLAAKIVAGGEGKPAQVFLRVYGPDDAVGREEPGSWTVAGPSFQSNLVFDWLEVHVNSKTRQTIDEIRLGTTWASVTAPWVGPPGPRNEAKP